MPASTSMITAAPRGIHCSEMSLSSPRPPATARAATAYSASTVPKATEAGSW